ncbi:hypothetical protein CLU79DRAFT_734698 [Phycomyces nitens]|nr:hypothetical protein CLU79DRAFT_734698 [Phycomyces nitens]
MFKFIIVALFSLLSLASAIVWNAPITSPSSGTKWRAGGTYTVKWKTTVAGMQIPEGVTGSLKLGYLIGSDYNEHLNWDLGSGFALNKGAYTITLPSDLTARTTYIVVLMGDSGNASKKFTIQSSKS